MEIARVGLLTGPKSYCFREPCGCSTLLSKTKEGREGGKATAGKAKAVLANVWRRLVGSEASFTRQQCLVFL